MSNALQLIARVVGDHHQKMLLHSPILSRSPAVATLLSALDLHSPRNSSIRVPAFVASLAAAFLIGGCGQSTAATPKVSTPAATTTPTPSPPPTPLPPTAVASAPPLIASPPRGGLLKLGSWWDTTYPTVPASRCTDAGASAPIGTEHAWQLPTAGALACVDEGPNAWSDHIISIEVFFPTPVSEQVAIATTVAVMPADAQRAGTFDGVNPGYSAVPSGTCREVVYTSQTLRAGILSLSSTWTGDPAKANFTLYSGNATAANGADRPYDPARVHLSSVGIDGENRGADGVVHC